MLRSFRTVARTLFAGFVLLSPLPAEAVMEPIERGLRLGPIDVQTELQVTSRYETNVFHTDQTPFSDLSSAIQPSLDVQYDGVRTGLQVGGYYERERYWGIQTAATTRQSTTSWTAEGRGEVQLLSGTTFEGSGQYLDTTDPLYADTTLARELLRRRHSEAELVVGQVVGTGLVESDLRYQFSRDVYPNAGAYDRSTHGAVLEMKLRTFPTFGLFGRIGYHHFQRLNAQLVELTSEADTVQGVVGFTGQFSPALKLLASLGTQFRSIGTLGDELRPVATVQATYRPNALSRWQLQYAYHSLDGVTSDELITNRGSLGWERKFGRAFELSLKGTVWHNTFRGPDTRRDFNLQGSAKIQYVPPGQEWLETELGYQGTRRKSSETIFSYRDHSTFLRVAFRY